MTSRTDGRSGSAAEIQQDQRSNKEWDNSRTPANAGKPVSSAPPFQRNLEAKRAPDFPSDPAKFKAWADDACRTWPEHLTAAAYWAHATLDKRVSNTEYVDDFATAYADYRKSQEVA